MKLILNIFLVAFFCFHFSSGKRTEETTQEEDGTIKTVITEEWETEERRGGRSQGRGRGDTIVVMTNDNGNAGHQQSDLAETRPTSVKCEEGLLNRLFDGKFDYHYSVDQKEQSVLGKSGYKFDASLGRIVINRECFPECQHLVPIIRLTHDPTTTHGLITPSGAAEKWILEGQKPQSAEVIGYGVLEKGACGANLAVRHLANKEVQIQTSSDAEYNSLKSNGFVTTSKTAPTFYVWGSSDQLTPPVRSPVENKTSVLTRMWKGSVYSYSIDAQEQEILDKAGHKYDGIVGRIVVKKEDMPDCPNLVPITRINYPSINQLVADAAVVKQFTVGGVYKIKGVIGYGVLTKGKCGATVPVRHVSGPARHLQITNAAEYAIYKANGWVDQTLTFYIWEA
jgi:hypothetical protein